MNSSVYEAFGNKIRIRVCGICHTQNSILLINHSGIRAATFGPHPEVELSLAKQWTPALNVNFLKKPG
jgi:hypothetical protein